MMRRYGVVFFMPCPLRRGLKILMRIGNKLIQHLLRPLPTTFLLAKPGSNAAMCLRPPGDSARLAIALNGNFAGAFPALAFHAWTRGSSLRKLLLQHWCRQLRNCSGRHHLRSELRRLQGQLRAQLRFDRLHYLDRIALELNNSTPSAAHKLLYVKLASGLAVAQAPNPCLASLMASDIL